MNVNKTAPLGREKGRGGSRGACRAAACALAAALAAQGLGAAAAGPALPVVTAVGLAAPTSLAAGLWSAAPETERYTLTFDTVEQAVLEGSPALEAAALEISALKSNDALSDASSGLMSAVSGLSGMASLMRNAKEQAASDNDYTAQMALEGVIALLEANIASMNSQAIGMWPKEAQIEQAELGLEQGRAAAVAGARMLYSTWHQLARQRADLAVTRIALDRQLRELELRESLGQVTRLAVEQVRVAAGQLELGDAALENGMTEILCQLNLLMGREADSELILAPMPAPVDDFAQGRKVEEDRAAALKNSFGLRNSRMELSNTKNPGKYEAISKQRRAMSLRIEADERSLSYKIDKLLRDEGAAAATVAQKRAEEEMAALKLEEAQLRFELGVASAAALETAREGLRTARSAVEAACQEQFMVQYTYTQLVAGVDLTAQTN